MKTDKPHTVYLKDYRPPEYLIKTADLDIELHPSRTRVRSSLHVLHNPAARKKTAPLKLDGEKLTLERITIDGKELTSSDYTLDSTSLTIKTPPKHPFTLEIVTICNPEANKSLSGLYRSRGIYCTQCEAEGFRRITYYLDRPDVLAKFRVRLEADKKEAPVLLANGNLVQSGDIPGTSRHYAIWFDPYPKPSYLFAVVGGNLAHIKDHYETASGREVELRIYAEPGKEERCRWAMESLKRAMRWDERRFGLEYDLDIFMIVAVSDFNMGAMENKGLNIFNDKLILARPDTATDADYESIEGVVAHEYFHNWTGNRVTCRDWFQLCLKEGLTVFRDQEFTSDERSRSVKRIEDVRFLKMRQFQEDSGPLAHPPRPSSFIEISNFYTVTVYEKGAEICRMLQTILGQAGFRKGLDLYFERHDGQAATVEDFVSAMADANKADLRQFMLWYNQAGTPELTVRFTYSAAKKQATLSFTQENRVTQPGKPKPQQIPVRLGLLNAKGKDLPLKLAGGKALKDGLLHIRKRKETYVFEGISERPVPSLLRDFSAPVKLKTNLNDRDLLFLMANDTNLFNRWEAAQTLGLNQVIRATSEVREGKRPRVNTAFVAALKKTINDGTLEPAYRAAFMALPSERDVAFAIGVDVDAEAVHRARSAVRARIGKALSEDLMAIYQKQKVDGPYSPDAESAGKRELRNACLGLLSATGGRTAMALVAEHYRTATNMTDVMAALSIFAQIDGPASRKAFNDFYRKWREEHLVMDKWFSLQAASPLPQTLTRIGELAQHKLFDLTNPNKVRAVYSTFAHGNQVRFNDASGTGYRMVADAVIAIDSFNPQIAARLAGAFESWRIFDQGRQTHARKALESIAAKPELSRDTYEIVSKILG